MPSAGFAVRAPLAMEAMEIDGLETDLETRSPNHADNVIPTMDLTPGPKHLICNYLAPRGAESLSILADYFGVAMAFAVLGELIRGSNKNKSNLEMRIDSRKVQRMGVQGILTAAMERLQKLAQNTRDIEEGLTDAEEARGNDRQSWEEEKACLLQRVAHAELEAGELRRMRDADSKANEKVVRIFAGQEQAWKSENKKLRHEIDLLRKDLIKNEFVELCTPRMSPKTGRCDKCRLKDKYVLELEEKLSEKEFLIMAAMEEARSEEQKRNELTAKLVKAQTVTAELTEKLVKEGVKSIEREVVCAEITSKQRATEGRLARVIEQLETTEKDLKGSISAAENHCAMSQKLVCDLDKLKQESEDKDEMISTLLERATVEREEKEDLARMLAEAQAKKRKTEMEIDRRKGCADRRAHSKSVGTDATSLIRHGHRSLGNQNELETIVDLQKTHAEEVKNLRSAHSRQIVALESKRAKVQQAPPPGVLDITTFIAQESLVDPTFKAGRGRRFAELEERHRHQMEAFERQLRVKDERLSVLRLKLLAMESELTQVKLQLEELTCRSLSDKAMCTTLVTLERKDLDSPHMQKIAMCSKCVNFENEILAHQAVVEELQKELENTKELLKEQKTEHESELLRVVENAETEIQQKDGQLAVLEAKLCQVQMQLEKIKRARELASYDNCQEKMFLDNIGETQERPFKDYTSVPSDISEFESKNSDAQVQSDLEAEQQRSLEDLVQEEGYISECSRQISAPKAVCLKEDQSTAIVILHNDMELEADGNLLLSPDHSLLTVLQKTNDKSLQAAQGDADFPSPVLFYDSVSEHKDDSSLTKSLSTSHTALSFHKKKRKSMSMSNLIYSPYLASQDGGLNEAIDNMHWTQDDMKAKILARFETFTELDKHHHQRTEQLESQASLSPVFSGKNAERNQKCTREDIQVLGLALEVRRIDQQLALLDKAKDAEPLGSGQATKVPSSSKHTRRYSGLAGKVTQFAKQMGLTSTESSVVTNPYGQVQVPDTRAQSHSGLSTHKDALMLQESSTSELAFLRQRAEMVSKDLAAIQTKLVKENCSDSPHQHTSTTLFPKSQLLDTVRAHLSHVQKKMGLKVAESSVEVVECPPSKRRTHAHSKAIVKEDKSTSALTRRESIPTKHDPQSRQGTRKARTQQFLRRLGVQLHQ